MKNKFDNILLVTDMDGTLLDERSNLSGKSIESIKYFIDNGGKFAFATGRNQKNMKAFADMVHPNAPSILYNGSLLYDFYEEKTVKAINIDDSVCEYVNKVFNSRPEVAIEIHKDGEIYELHPNKMTEFHMSIVDFQPIYIDSYTDVPFPWIKVGFWVDGDNIDDFYKFGERLNNDKFNFIRVHEFSCEYLNKNADKGILLNEYRRLYPGIKIISCGDNANDAVMMKNSDLSFAPQNAFDPVKNSASFVLDTDCNNSFISEVIKRIENFS